MRKLLTGLAFILVVVPVFSQSVDAAATSQYVQTERNRIQTDRVRLEAQYEREETACYARFAVTDCLLEVRVRRREALSELRRQEVELNNAERKRKALEQIERIEKKSSIQRDDRESANGL